MKQAEFLNGACEKCGGDGSIRKVNPAWLRERRKAADVTMCDMAKRLDVSAAYLCDVEHGRRAVQDYVHEAYRNLGSGSVCILTVHKRAKLAPIHSQLTVRYGLTESGKMRPMSPVPAQPPAIIEEAKQHGQAVMRSFEMTRDAIRKILSTRKLLLSKKAQRRHLEAAVADFEAKTKIFKARLDAQNAMVKALAEENARLKKQASPGTTVTEPEDRPLFFTHIREAISILRGKHA